MPLFILPCVSDCLLAYTYCYFSLKYPKANGLVEKTVQTAKKLMSKALEDKSDPYLAILEYQNTPIDDSHHSPAKLLMSCQL